MAETEEPVEAVADTGPLLHLDELEALDLLIDFPRALIPEAVQREVLRHRPPVLRNLPASCRFVMSVLPADPSTRHLFQLFSLDAGEREALSLALATPGSVLLTDDSAARLAAKSLGIRAYGTLGVLLRSVRRGRRTRNELLEVLRSLPSRSTLHLRKDLLEKVISEAENYLGP